MGAEDDDSAGFVFAQEGRSKVRQEFGERPSWAHPLDYAWLARREGEHGTAVSKEEGRDLFRRRWEGFQGISPLSLIRGDSHSHGLIGRRLCSRDHSQKFGFKTREEYDG